ncbi:MAG: hypothetical protein M1831_006631 [Alyxoria varia]|nr:MAG: hypothetical protein M1831_006631 [Alyxoria varia]
MAGPCKSYQRSKAQASERRKTQNRAAQKKYREKQRNRLQELEKLAEVRLNDDDTQVNAAPLESGPKSLVVDVQEIFNDEIELMDPTQTIDLTGTEANLFSAGYAPTPSTANDIATLGLSRVNTDSSHTGISDFDDDFSFLPLNEAGPDTASIDLTSSHYQDAWEMAPEPTDPGAPYPRVVDLADPSTDTGNDMLTDHGNELRAGDSITSSDEPVEPASQTSCKSTSDIDQSENPIFGECQKPFTPFAQGLCESSRKLQLHNALGQPQEDPQHSKKRDVVPDIIRRLRLDDVEDNECAIRNVVNMNYSMRDVFLAGLKFLGGRHVSNKRMDGQSVVRSAPGGNLPDANRNTLQLVKISSTRAMLANANALEYDFGKLYQDNAKSKFHHMEESEGAEVRTDPSNRWQRVQQYPQDLIPVMQQFDSAHPPWLDLIPFPTFRARAISAILATPPLIDHKELKTDVVINEGLRCWHGGEVEDARNSANAITAGIGQPWDRRSWDAAPWFLRKYWMLLGGEESELWENTSWWRGFRGEKSVSNRWDETTS